MFHIITDSTADMPVEWYKKFNIHLMPLEIRIKDNIYLDKENITDEDFYTKISEPGVIPSTSCPPPGTWIEKIKEIASPGDSVITLHLSSKLSGSYNSACVAARELRDKFDIRPFDTRGGSTVVGYMCREIREMSNANFSVESILNRLMEIKNSHTICFVLDTVKYAVGSGRYGGVRQAVASMIPIKPIVFVQEDGTMKIEGISRTLQKGLNRMLDSVQKRYGDQLLNVGVMYAKELKHTQKLIDKIKEKLNVNEIILTNINLTIASHIGPGATGMAAYPVK